MATARMKKTEAPQPPAPGAHAPGPAAASSRHVGSTGVMQRKYRVRVRGDIPDDLSVRVSAAHASAIHGRPKAESEANARLPLAELRRKVKGEHDDGNPDTDDELLSLAPRPHIRIPT